MPTLYEELPVASDGAKSAEASPSTEPGPFGRLIFVESTPLAPAGGANSVSEERRATSAGRNDRE
jgi:hypothetical protein